MEAYAYGCNLRSLSLNDEKGMIKLPYAVDFSHMLVVEEHRKLRTRHIDCCNLTSYSA